MRRVDLVVGAELYYDRSREWETNSWNRPTRAVVVAVEPYKAIESYSLRSGPRLEPVKSGPGVLVDLYYESSPDTANRRVVNVTHLRGPYAETKARVDEAVAAGVRARQTVVAEEQGKATRAAELLARAKVLGVYGAVEYVQPWREMPSEYRAVLSLDTFEAVLDRLEEG